MSVYVSSMYVHTFGPFVPRLGMGLDGHLGEVIGYNNNINNNSNDNDDNNITTLYNREPLSSIYVQTIGPFVPRLGMGLDGHLGGNIGQVKVTSQTYFARKRANLPHAEFKQGRQLLDLDISTGLVTSLLMNTSKVGETGCPRSWKVIKSHGI